MGNFKEELKEMSMNNDELNYEQALDFFIQEQNLNLICDNPRGREKIAEIFNFVLNDNGNEVQKNKIYSAESIKNIIGNGFNNLIKNGFSISYERKGEESEFFKQKQKEIVGLVSGKERYTVSIDSAGNLVCTKQRIGAHREEFLANENIADNKVALTAIESVYSKSGLEQTRTSSSYTLEGRDAINPYFIDVDKFNPNRKGAEKRKIIRTDTINATVFDEKVNEDGKYTSKQSYACLNPEHGIDDMRLVVDSIPESEYVSYKDMNLDSQKEEHRKQVISAISKSKFKKALCDITPDVEISDVEQELEK